MYELEETHHGLRNMRTSSLLFPREQDYALWKLKFYKRSSNFEDSMY